MSAALPFAGLTVVVTGDAPGMDRDQAKAAVARLGGKPSGSVSASTGLVVAGKGAGVSKMDKARQLGTPVLPSEAFAALVADPSSWDGQPLGAPLSASADAPKRVVEKLGAHRIGTASGTFDDVWAVRVWCCCGWKFQAPLRAAAKEAGKAHSREGNAVPSALAD
jgi:BRCT domain type II-containing protein